MLQALPDAPMPLLALSEGSGSAHFRFVLMADE